jgi:acetyltransferase
MMPELERILVPRLGEILIRPLRRPDDEPAYLRFGAAMAADDLRMRFAVPIRWTPALAERLLSLGGATFAAFDEDGEILGLGRTAAKDVGLGVRSDLKRRGLGRALLERIVQHAVERGISDLAGTLLAENRPMLAFARTIGFRAIGSNGPLVSMRLCLP